METKDKHKFSADRPIADAEDDLLDRASFSKDLAKVLSSWHGDDSLVVALHGDWGSGKSSIKNMAVSELESLGDGKPDIIKFTPWEWAAQDKITESFFQEISTSIGREDKSERGKKLALLFKKHGRYLNTGELIVAGLSAAFLALYIFAVTVGIFSTFTEEHTARMIIRYLLMISIILAGALKWGKKILSSLSGNLEDKEKEQEKGLHEIRKEITDLLCKRKKSILVVMDDLDRLTSDQLQMVFQLVKANTDFPKIIFLLLFQRDLVEEKFDDGKQLGRDYLEKIIQVSFDIPKIEITKIHGVLFTKIDALLEQDKSASEMFDSEYWGDIFHGSLSSYFNNLRDVYRYISTLSFYFSFFKGKVAFEVNPVDLVAIECLRSFEPDVYKEIARAKEIFTSNGPSGEDREGLSIQAVASNIFKKASAGKENIVTNLVKQLFPNIQWVFRGMEYSRESENIWAKEMRICHSSHFDKYFQFSIPENELSNSELKKMLALTSNAEKLSSFIMSFEDRGIIENALAQFGPFVDEVSLEDGYPYVKGLLDIGDKVDHELVGFTMFNSNIYAYRLVVLFLKRIEDTEDRSSLLLQCFKDSDGLSIVGRILRIDDVRREKSEEDIVLSDSGFSVIKQEFVNRLDYMADNVPDQLMNHGHLAAFLYCWKSWGNEEEVTSWLQEQVENTEEGCIKLLKAFTRESFAQETKYIKLEEIENFIEIGLVVAKVMHIDIDTLDADAKKAVEAFNQAIDDRKKELSMAEKV